MIATTPLLIASLLPALNESHPRLFFTQRDLVTIRKRIAEPGRFSESWKLIWAEADKLLTASFVPESEAEAGEGQHGDYGKASHQLQHMAQTLGFVYAVTGEKRYADKLCQAMLHYAGYRRWTGKVFLSWDPPWRSELNTAHFAAGQAIGYDLIYEHLSAEQRRVIVDAIVRLGLRPMLEDWVGPVNRIHSLDSMGHNWWSVIVGAAGIAAIAIEDSIPQARDWADRVAQVFPEWFAYTGNTLQNKMQSFDRTGGLYESVGYTAYSLLDFFLFRRAYRHARPERAAVLDNIPQLAGIPNYFLQTCYPTDDGVLTVNFGDQHYEKPVLGMIVLLALEDAESDRAAAMRWYFDQTTGQPSNMYEMLLFDANAPRKTPAFLPLSHHWPDMGWAVLRDRWDAAATLLAIKCGDTWNHAHADAGSFILWAQGEPILIDSGTCTYGNPAYPRYFLRSQAHNVVLLNGQGQSAEDVDRGSKFRGTIPVMLDAGPDSMRLVQADATGPTAAIFSRNYRTWLWVTGHILVFDDLRSHTPGRAEWLIHHTPDAEFKTERDNLTITTHRSVTNVRTIWPTGVRYEQREGLRDHQPDETVAYHAAVMPESTRETKILTAIRVANQNNPPPPVMRRLEGEHYIATAWESDGLVTEVYLNLRADGRRMHRNSNAEIGPWQTDAYLLATQRATTGNPDDISVYRRVLMCAGSYLRLNDTIAIDALAQVHAVWEPHDDPPRLTLQSPNARAIRLHTPSNQRTILLNGSQTPCSHFDSDTHLTKVSFIP